MTRSREVRTNLKMPLLLSSEPDRLNITNFKNFSQLYNSQPTTSLRKLRNPYGFHERNFMAEREGFEPSMPFSRHT